jgi:hypothetical protein
MALLYLLRRVVARRSSIETFNSWQNSRGTLALAQQLASLDPVIDKNIGVLAYALQKMLNKLAHIGVYPIT